jgi:WD40 repeat protein
MVRRQQAGIARLDGMIRLWCLLFFVGAAVLLGREAYVAVAAAVRGWPTGEVRSLFLRGNRVVDVAFGADGSLLLATPEKGEPVAWDIRRGKRVAFPADAPHGLACARARMLLGKDLLRLTTPDGRIALEVVLQFEQDRAVVVRDGQGTEPRRLIGHEAPINAIALTPDGKRALTGSEDKTVRLWDVVTGTELQCLRGHQKPVTCVQIAPGGATAFSGDRDGRVRGWDLKAGRELPVFGRARCHDEVGFLSVSADGRRLLSTGRRQASGPRDFLCLWDTSNAALLAEFSDYNIGEGQTALSPDGRWAVSTGLGMVQLWRLER